MSISHGFKLDKERLENISLLAYNALTSRYGIFHRGHERFLPQYHIPKELEHSPVQTTPKETYQASNYLWTCAFFERITQSSTIIRNANSTWNNPNSRWIFDPKKVKSAKLEDIARILQHKFQFNLQGVNEETPAQRFKYNANLLVDTYGADPRNLIKYKTVNEARAHLTKFKGIGTGIANLFIHYLLDRNLASPLDPENSLLKVDIHKGRIPINTNAVTPTNHEIARDDAYVSRLEKTYHEICTTHNLSPALLDAALWIIGSEICADQDMTKCRHNCPLFEDCAANAPEDKNTGRYVVLTAEGKRLDSRKHTLQAHLF